LLREQAQRCRSILTKLARPEESVVEATQYLPIGALLDDLAAPYRGEDVEIVIEIAPDQGPQPKVWRRPELLHGLSNIVENAADFAESRVRVTASWDDARLRIAVVDDGPGFAPEIFERIGEPYITSRPGDFALGASELGAEAVIDKHEGMGLGFFIAKTLIEQTGGRVEAGNLPGHGARVRASWPRGVIDGEKRPANLGGDA
jgi:two-component system sensor histidine kinase RegB